MIVCLCKGITEEDLERASRSCNSPQEVMRKLGVAQDCGVCLITALEKMQKGHVLGRNCPDKK